jgi:hypothetical protein
MKDMANWVKYAIIGGFAWIVFGFRGAIGALVGAAGYDVWKKYFKKT